MSAPVCLSIQSGVVAGHVGNGAAVPALVLEGVEALALPTVLLSGHAARRGVQGRGLPGAEIAALGQGLADGGDLSRCDAILTGYTGGEDAACAVADLVDAAKAARPDALYLCDPVLGDDGPGLYLPEAVGEIHRDRLLPRADIAAPNRFELEWLTGIEARDARGVLTAARALRALGPKVVHVTSAPLDGRVGVLSLDDTGAWLCSAPRAPGHLHGAGDFVAALMLAGALRGMSPAEAAARAVGAASVLAQAALQAGRDDLPVTAEQARWRAAPPAQSVQVA